jgi:tetratricopeptide (TPR) repeat protein
VVNPEAYDQYLRGQHILSQFTPERTARAIESFQHSLDIDPGFAPAWGGLAMANFARGMWIGGNEDWRVILPEVERAARRALALDQRQIDALIALGGIDALYNWKWQEAEERYRRAIEIDPDHIMARIMLSNLLNWLGRLDEAEVQAREAVRLAPTSPIALNELVFVYQSQGRSEEWWELAQKALELDPHYVQSMMFYAPEMVRKGRVEEGLAMAEEVLRVCPDSSMVFLKVAEAYELAGRPDRAGELVQELVARSHTGFVPPGDLFRLYFVLGNMPLALDYLEQAYEARDPRMIMLRLMSQIPALASEPRFQEIYQKMDFPEI